jgi:hypothetical protein
MKIENVTQAKEKDDRSIELTITDPFGGPKIIKRYAAIRGGITWPTSKAPAYFCIVGEEYIAPRCTDEKAPPGPRIPIAEFMSDSLSMQNFYDRLIDLAEQMMCRDFYVDLPEERWACGYENDLNEAVCEQKAKVYLYDAYDKDSFILGVSRIKSDFDKGNLKIPKDSIVFSQLQALTREDLDNSPEENFYSINALRHVISSYYRYAPVIKLPLNSRLRKLAELADSCTTHMAY